jgi:pSer/pThr/pTyr-binding forkhead associated (FHA) protein
MATWGKIASKGDPNLKVLFRVRAKRQQFNIGRRPDCALKLDDRHISTVHLRVTAFVGE